MHGNIFIVIDELEIMVVVGCEKVDYDVYAEGEGDEVTYYFEELGLKLRKGKEKGD